MGRGRLVAIRMLACQQVLDEADSVGGARTRQVDHRGSKAMIEEPVGEAQHMVDGARAQVSVPKIRFYSNGDEVRRGPTQMRCGLRVGWRDGSEHLCQETDESSTRYNKRHTSSGSGVSALRPRRQYGRHTRDESIRSIFPRSRSAKASLGQWACRGCPWPVIDV